MKTTSSSFDFMVTAGCSFTHDGAFTRWTGHVRSALSIPRLFDLSRPGAGNRQIANSVINHFETHPHKSRGLVVVMWSGYDRDDIIGSAQARRAETVMLFNYSKHAVWLGTGGAAHTGNSLMGLECIQKQTSRYSRALENYFTITTLWHYLASATDTQVIFTEYHGVDLYPEETQFDPVPYLSTDMAERFCRLVRTLQPNLGDYARTHHRDSSPDGYHPGAEAHRGWAHEVLIPAIQDSTATE